MKSFFALLLSSLLLLSMLTACNRNPEDPSDETASSDKSESDSDSTLVFGDFEYIKIENSKNNELAISGYRGTDKHVTLPAQIQGNPVVALNYSAFAFSDIESISMPDSIVFIASGAFYHCQSLIAIEFSDNIVTIGSEAFAACTALKSVQLPKQLQILREAAFRDCTALERVWIPKTLQSFGLSVFTSDAALSEIIFEEGCTSVGFYSLFGGCTALKSITIPASVKTLPQGAFWGATNLTEVRFLGDAPMKIEKEPFLLNEDLKIYYDPSTSGWDTTSLRENYTLIPNEK